MGDAFFDGVLAFGNVELGYAAVQLLLLDGVQAFASVVDRPVGIDAVASVVGGLTLAGGDVITTDDRAARTVRAVYDTLAYTSVQGGEQISFRCLYVFLRAFDADAVTPDRDVMLQCIIDTVAERPLLWHVVLRFHPGRQEKQAGEEYG